MTRHPKHTRHAARPPAPQDAEGAAPEGTIVPADGPSFAQPVFTPDPTEFKVYHGSDSTAYKKIDAYNKTHKAASLPFPLPRGVDAQTPEPVLTLQQVLNNNKAAIKAIEDTGQIVFHALGDSGSTRGPETQNEVADKLESDFDERDKADVPCFLFHLGDVVYSFGEAKYYFDQFYDAYRDYPGPILAIPGNHDGMVAPGSDVPTLDAFLRNFCQENFVFTPESGGLSRTAQIQPGVFYTFEAPFVRILALYSGTLEDPGVIADKDIGNAQLQFLEAALKRVKKEKYEGALIIAHHHPAYTYGSHGWSKELTAQIDEICTKTGIWPHAVFSGHAHNYQRFTRTHGKMQIPYLVNGNGGHPPLQRLARKYDPPLRTPVQLQGGKEGDSVIFENYDDQDYGYLRVIANSKTLRIEYHPASDGPAAKTPDDVVTIDLQSRTIS
jgi:hypothetical protein